MLCNIYKITNIINNKVYVGQTWKPIQKRFLEHKAPAYKGCKHLHAALNKYGRDNFIIEFITVCGTQDAADYWEIYFIEKYDSINNGYNIREGGTRNHPEDAAKISRALKGRPSPLKGRSQPKELVLRRTRGQKGRKHSPEHIAKWVDRMKGRTMLSKEQVIEVQQCTLPVKEACDKFGISSSTYYEYRAQAPEWTKSIYAKKLTEDKVKELIVDRQSGMTFLQLGEKYNISTATACQAANGKTWKQVARHYK